MMNSQNKKMISKELPQRVSEFRKDTEIHSRFADIKNRSKMNEQLNFHERENLSVLSDPKEFDVLNGDNGKNRHKSVHATLDSNKESTEMWGDVQQTMMKKFEPKSSRPFAISSKGSCDFPEDEMSVQLIISDENKVAPPAIEKNDDLVCSDLLITRNSELDKADTHEKQKEESDSEVSTQGKDGPFMVPSDSELSPITAGSFLSSSATRFGEIAKNDIDAGLPDKVTQVISHKSICTIEGSQVPVEDSKHLRPLSDTPIVTKEAMDEPVTLSKISDVNIHHSSFKIESPHSSTIASDDPLSFSLDCVEAVIGTYKKSGKGSAKIGTVRDVLASALRQCDELLSAPPIAAERFMTPLVNEKSEPDCCDVNIKLEVQKEDKNTALTNPLRGSVSPSNGTCVNHITAAPCMESVVPVNVKNDKECISIKEAAVAPFVVPTVSIDDNENFITDSTLKLPQVMQLATTTIDYKTKKSDQAGDLPIDSSKIPVDKDENYTQIKKENYIQLKLEEAYENKNLDEKAQRRSPRSRSFRQRCKKDYWPFSQSAARKSKRSNEKTRKENSFSNHNSITQNLYNSSETETTEAELSRRIINPLPQPRATQSAVNSIGEFREMQSSPFRTGRDQRRNAENLRDRSGRRHPAVGTSLFAQNRRIASAKKGSSPQKYNPFIGNSSQYCTTTFNQMTQNFNDSQATQWEEGRHSAPPVNLSHTAVMRTCKGRKWEHKHHFSSPEIPTRRFDHWF
mmetsp:Transcript_28631/g.65440  ORF Transcript_28631/g.65440 Transcript_28631/m.65440 type:complete len:740 (-) Transcript_28631:162-2381(-)